MEKLSSILATSPRVRAVDLADAHPVRPGTPTFGRPVGTTLRDRVSVSQDAKDMAFAETLAAVNPRNSKSGKVADEAYKKFFDQKMRADEIKGRAGAASELTQERESEIEEMIKQEPPHSHSHVEMAPPEETPLQSGSVSSKSIPLEEEVEVAEAAVHAQPELKDPRAQAASHSIFTHRAEVEAQN